MFDVLQILFWSITYVLVIISGFKSRSKKMIAMPHLACAQNFAWESIALIKSSGFWAHILWFGLDLFIVLISFKYLNNKKHKCIFLSVLFTYLIIFALIFSIPRGMLYSSFVIDLIMALCFLIQRKTLSNELKVSIAITKLLGDAFAGIYYGLHRPIIATIAIIVFICNTTYLVLCIKESIKEKNQIENTV